MLPRLSRALTAVGVAVALVAPPADAMRRVRRPYHGGAPTMEAAVEATWPASLHDEAKNVAWCESTGDPGAHRRGSQFVGLFQLGHEVWRTFGRGSVWNPFDNAAAAYRLYQARGFGPWQCSP